MIGKQNMLQLLHSLGYLYADHGQNKRALVFQLIASRLEPESRPVLRTLAHTFLSDGAPDKALAVIARLRALDDDDPMLDLLQGRALWRAGHKSEARRIFQRFIVSRRPQTHA